MAKRVKAVYHKLFSEKDGIEDIDFLARIDYEFSDGETCIHLDQDVNGRIVSLFQTLQDPKI